MTGPVDDVVVTEAKRQTVILLFAVTGTATMLWIESLRDDTVTRRRVVMWAALTAKRVSDTLALPFTVMSAKAATIYHNAKEG